MARSQKAKMHIPIASRLLFIAALSTTTACAAFEDSHDCTAMDVASAIQIPHDLIPLKDGRVEVCVNSTCRSIELSTSTTDEKDSLSLPDASDARRTNVTIKITAEGMTTFRGKND